MQLCAITDGEHRLETVSLAWSWAAGGVNFIQLREKALNATQLQALVERVVANTTGSRSKVLVNVSSPEAAIQAIDAGADGVHFAGKPIPSAASRLRSAFPNAIISLPCHTLDEVELAHNERANLILFSPVFEKLAAAPQGLQTLARACTAAQGTPVFALGGVTVANAHACIEAGAAGVAGIRLFAGEEWRALRRYIVD